MTSKEEQARREGMSYALRYAREHGLDALEEDLKKRGAYNIPIRISDKDLKAFTDNVKNMMLDTVLILTSVTLRDEFGFGKQRLERFKQRFNFKAECIGEDFASWQDMIDILKEECDMEFQIRQYRDAEHFNVIGNIFDEGCESIGKEPEEDLFYK